MLRTDVNGLKKELEQNALLFNVTEELTFVSPKNNWTVFGNLKCTSNIDQRNKDKVIVTCDYSLDNNESSKPELKR